MSNEQAARIPENQTATGSYYVLLFVLFFISYAYFFQGGGWNQNIRICLTRAIIHEHSFIVDRYKEDTREMAFVNSGDWAYYNGHYYCNKSPGLSLLAVPPFAIAEFCLRYLFPGDPERQVLLSAYFSNLTTVVPMSALLGVLMFHVFQYFFRMRPGTALLAALCFGFGTLAFPYSTAFYCHQPAAFCSFCSFVLAMHMRHDRSRGKNGMALLAGFSAGLGVLIEPSAIYLLGAVLLYMGYFKTCRPYIPLFILGCIPSALVQGYYNFSCFGSPLASSYNYSNDLVMWKVQGKLFGIPTIQTLLELLILPYRGLFVSSPVLLLSLPGALFLFRKKTWRAEAVACMAVSLFFILFTASFYAWNGGSAPGPRYLLPAYPFIFLLAGFSLSRVPYLFAAAGIASLLINLAITVIAIEIPREIQNPLIDVVLKNILAGRVSINPVPFSHFSSYPDIYQLAKIETWPLIQNSNSFNLGELVFPHRPVSIVPLLCFWLLWGFWWVKTQRRLL
jgi:4-amino-4-deoxy-L-arabinose transferase-like glycosyltransferase